MFTLQHPQRLARGRLIALLLGISTLALACVDGLHAESHDTLADKTLVAALQQGGYTLYFRHAETDWSQSDRVRERGDWNSCDPNRIRQLSAAGRRTAQAVGKAMHALEIPVGEIHSSPYCRTRETAQLLQLGAVQTTTDVMNMRVAEYFGGHEALVARTRSRLAIVPKPGTNTVYVAHGNIISEATGEYPSEAESLVFKANGTGGFDFIGRLTAKQWQRLARD